MVTDPVSGALLDYDRTAYRPPAELVEFLIARDRTCRFPSCNRQARLCDLDHAQPWDQGGATSAANCGAACRRQHRLKTHAGWRLRSHPDGSATWTSRTGHQYHQAAVDHCPEHTAHLRAVREADAAIAAEAVVEVASADDQVGPSTASAPALATRAAGESSVADHDDDAADEPPDEPHTDTNSGNDPPF